MTDSQELRLMFREQWFKFAKERGIAIPMTNREKYLKDGADLNELANELMDYIYSLPYEVSLNDAIYDYFGETVEDMNGGGYID